MFELEWSTRGPVYVGNTKLTQNTLSTRITVKSCLQPPMYIGIVECYTDLGTSPVHFKKTQFLFKSRLGIQL